MRRAMSRRGPVVALSAVLLVAVVACQPVLVGSTTCPTGTHRLESTQVTRTISTAYGPVTASVTPGNVSLTLTSSSWSLTGDLSVAVTGSTPYGPLTGTIAVTGSAGGPASIGGGTVTFTLTSLSGSATFTGTVGSVPVTQSLTMSQLGEASALYGLTGSVPYTCGSSGLTLTFPSFVHRF